MRRVGWGAVRFLLLRLEQHLSFEGSLVERDRVELRASIKAIRELVELDAKDDALARANAEAKVRQLSLVA